MKYWRHNAYFWEPGRSGTEFLEMPLLDDKKVALETFTSPDIWGKEILGLYGKSVLHPNDKYSRKIGRTISENKSTLASFHITKREEDAEKIEFLLVGPSSFLLRFYKDSGKLIIV